MGRGPACNVADVATDWVRMASLRCFLWVTLGLVALVGCGRSSGPLSDSPEGPASIEVPANLKILVAQADPKRGAALYVAKGCKACHNLNDVKLVGPGLKGIANRRTLPWMARMILKPEVMIREDAEAKKLFAQMMAPMANQNINAETELPLLLAFLQTL